MTRQRGIIVGAVVAIILVVVVIVVSQGRGGPGVAPAPSTGSGTPTAPGSTAGSPTAGSPTAPSPTAPSSVPPGSSTPTSSAFTPTPPPAPSASPTPRPPLPIESTASIEQGATVAIVSRNSVTSTAVGPGDVAGPAIQVGIEVAAGSDPIDLSQVVVNAYYGARLTPAQVASGPGVVPFDGVLQAGERATAVLVFNVPADQRDEVTIDVFYDAVEGQIRFRGTV